MVLYAHPAMRIDPHILEIGVIYHRKWQERDVILVKDRLGCIEIFETVDYNLIQVEKAIRNE